MRLHEKAEKEIDSLLEEGETVLFAGRARQERYCYYNQISSVCVGSLFLLLIALMISALTGKAQTVLYAVSLGAIAAVLITPLLYSLIPHTLVLTDRRIFDIMGVRGRLIQFIDAADVRDITLYAKRGQLIITADTKTQASRLRGHRRYAADALRALFGAKTVVTPMHLKRVKAGARARALRDDFDVTGKLYCGIKGDFCGEIKRKSQSLAAGEGEMKLIFSGDDGTDAAL